MPSFSPLLDRSQELSKLSTEDKMAFTDEVLKYAKDKKLFTPEQERQFQKAQMTTLYEYDKKEGRVPEGMDEQTWQNANLDPSAYGYSYEGRYSKRVNDLAKQRLVGDLKAVGKVATDFSAYPKAAAKFATDLAQLGGGIAGALYGGAQSALMRDFGGGEEEGLGFLGGFSKGMEYVGENGSVKAINKWYDDAIKSDPEMYKAYHAALTDATIGALFGGARVAKMGAAAAQASGISRARTFFAPVVSNVAGGRLVEAGLEGIDDSLKDSKLSDAEKNGIRLMAILGMSLASGVSFEPIVERAVVGEAKAVQAARAVSEAAEQGKPLVQAIQENPYLSDELKQIVSEATGKQILDATEPAQKLDNLLDAQNKVMAGHEMSAEEAAMFQALRPVERVEPLRPDEVVSFKKELTPFQETPDGFLDKAVPMGGKATASDISLAPSRKPAVDGPQVESSTPGAQKTVLERIREKNLPEEKAAEKIFAEKEEVKKLPEQGQGSGQAREEILPLSLGESIAAVEGIRTGNKHLFVKRATATLNYLEQEAARAKAAGALEEALIPLREHYNNVKMSLAVAENGFDNTRRMLEKEISTATQDYKEAIAAKSPDLADSLQKKIDVLTTRLDILNRPPQITRPKEKELVGPAISKAADVVERSDILTKVDALPSEQRIRVQRVAEAISQGREELLMRKLSEEERLDDLAHVYATQGERDRIYAPSQGKDTADGLSAGWVEDNYPSLARLASFLNPETVSTGVITPDTVLKISQSLVHRAGLGMSQEGYLKTRELMKEAFEVWDDVKGRLNTSEKGKELKGFLKEQNKLFGLSTRQAEKVADAIADAFPNLKIAFQYDDGLKAGVQGLADSLTKLVTLGADQKGLRVLTHEIGHMHFSYGLDAESKLSWLDSMRNVAEDEAAWARNFPGYSDQMAGLTGLDEAADMKQAFWLHSPAEMYAQQFGAYMLDKVIPRADTLSLFGVVQREIKQLFKSSSAEFEKLPEETQRFFLEGLARPDAETAMFAHSADIDEALKNSWLTTGSRDLDMERVAEIEAELNASYNQTTVGTYSGDALYDRLHPDMRNRQFDEANPFVDEAGLEYSATDMSSVANAIEQTKVDFWSLPVGERVIAYRLEDLNKVLEVQGLKILHGLPGANVEEAQLVAARLEKALSSENAPELIERLAGPAKARSKFGQNVDVLTGERFGSAAEKRLQDWESRVDDQNTEYRLLDAEAQAEVDKENLQRFVQNKKKLDAILQDWQQAEGKSLSKKAKKSFVDNAFANTPPANSLEQSFRKFLSETVQEAEPWDAARASATKLVASMRQEFSDVSQLLNLAMAKRGMIDIVDNNFQRRLSEAEMFAQAAGGKRYAGSPGTALKLAIRWGAAIAGGLESDPDSPLGYTWNPERFFSSPLLIAIVPGSGRLASLGLRQGKKLASFGFSKLPPSLKAKLENQTAQVERIMKASLTEGMGMPDELKDSVSTSRVFGRAKQQEYLEFAEVLLRHFSPKERKAISRVAMKEAGWQGLSKWATEYRPDILSAANSVRLLSEKVQKEFKKLGIESDVFNDVLYAPLPRYFTNLGKKNLKAIFEGSNISQVKMSILEQKGVPFSLSATTKQGNPSFSYKAFKEHLANSGITPTPGMKVNEWRTTAGTKVFTIADTPLDQAAAKKLSAGHVWGIGAGGYVIDNAGKGSIKMRRDFTRSERKLMGECQDVSVRLAYMGELLQRSYERAHLFDNLSRSKFIVDPKYAGDVLFPGQTGLISNAEAVRRVQTNDIDWRWISDAVNEKTGVAKFGSLAGKYVHRDVYEALQLLDKEGNIKRAVASSEVLSSIAAGHQNALRLWKLSKTVASPTAHVNNFVSNIAMGFLLGHNPAAELKHGFQILKVRDMELQARQLWKDGKQAEATRLQQLAQQSPYYSSYLSIRKSGMTDSSMWASELHSEELAKQLAQEVSEDGARGAIQSMFSFLKGAGAKAARVYENGDLIFKMGSFHKSLQEGMNASDALRKAYEAYFDYSNLAPAAKVMRDTGLIPFVSYAYKAVPALVKAVKEHPERLALMMLALQGVHTAGVASLYGSDNLLQNTEALDEALPSYMKKKSFGGLLRSRILVPGMGGEVITAQGQKTVKADYLDLSRMIPSGDMWETKGGLSDAEFSLKGVGEALGNMLLQSPVILNAMNAVAGGNLALGQPFNKGGDIDAPEVKKRIANEWLSGLWNSVAPNWPILPYTYSNKAFMEALVGEGIVAPGTFGTYGSSGQTSQGIAKPFTTAVAGMAGVKIRSILPEMAIASEMKRADWELRKETGYLNKIFKNPSISQDARQEALQSYQNTAKKVQQEQQKRHELFLRLREGRQKALGAQSLPQ